MDQQRISLSKKKIEREAVICQENLEENQAIETNDLNLLKQQNMDLQARLKEKDHEFKKAQQLFCKFKEEHQKAKRQYEVTIQRSSQDLKVAQNQHHLACKRLRAAKEEKKEAEKVIEKLQNELVATYKQIEEECMTHASYYQWCQSTHYDCK